jgi:putative endonuclease
LIQGFTKKYKVKNLVYFEVNNDIYEAIKRERAIKKCFRKWKTELIEKTNPAWIDFYEEIIKYRILAFPGMTE